MKKYKLIRQRYPMDFPVGTIALCSKYFLGAKILEPIKGGTLAVEYGFKWILDYPEFWEEVKEKEYSILSFANKSGDLFNLHPDGNYYYKSWLQNGIIKFPGFSLKDCLDGTLKIHSVKRLSDGETFTIGNKANFGKIEALKIGTDNSNLWIQFPNSGGYWLVASLKLDKTKPILFTTEDGVDIYSMDKTYWILIEDMSYLYSLTFYTAHLDLDLKNIFKVFSTKEAADKYISDNKPKHLFTTEDGFDAYQGCTIHKVDKRLDYAGTFEASSINSKAVALENGCRWFSSEKAAKEYIVEKKEAEEVLLRAEECLSLNDLTNIWSGFGRKDLDIAVENYNTALEMVKKKVAKKL